VPFPQGKEFPGEVGVMKKVLYVELSVFERMTPLASGYLDRAVLHSGIHYVRFAGSQRLSLPPPRTSTNRHRVR
jgi:hypothetical protein